MRSLLSRVSPFAMALPHSSLRDSTRRICLAIFLPCAAFAADADFTPLFNGKDLTGWDGDPALWKVENGIIIGTNASPEAMANNSFLDRKSVV